MKLWYSWLLLTSTLYLSVSISKLPTKYLLLLFQASRNIIPPTALHLRHQGKLNASQMHPCLDLLATMQTIKSSHFRTPYQSHRITASPDSAVNHLDFLFVVFFLGIYFRIFFWESNDCNSEYVVTWKWLISKLLDVRISLQRCRIAEENLLPSFNRSPDNVHLLSDLCQFLIQGM